MELKREIKFYPAFDKRDKDPKKNYGIHGVNLTFYVKGPLGVVQFVIFTNWQVPQVQKEFKNKEAFLSQPIPADLGYHSYKPMYEGQDVMEHDCPILGGKPCYYDGSGLNAQPMFDLLCEQGDEALWEALEKYYHQTFGEES